MRVDQYLFKYGFTKSRQNAKILIEDGNIIIDAQKIIKPSADIDETNPHKVQILNKPRFVSRGGEKLDYALNSFNIDVDNKTCIDIGASTGGFTDCLIQRGAGVVYAVDSGHSQLDASLENNEKVISIEKYNAKFMQREDFPTSFDIAVMDVSFISQNLLHKGINSVLQENGYLISLIKPQFECGKNALNSNGIVKNRIYHKQAIESVIDNAHICGFSCLNLIRSPIEGGSGNVEFLILLQKSDIPTNFINENKIKNISQT